MASSISVQLKSPKILSASHFLIPMAIFCWSWDTVPLLFGRHHLQQTHGVKINTVACPLWSYQSGRRISGVLSIFFLVPALQTWSESGIRWQCPVWGSSHPISHYLSQQLEKHCHCCSNKTPLWW
jgi:hypothetical protein